MKCHRSVHGLKGNSTMWCATNGALEAPSVKPWQETINEIDSTLERLPINNVQEIVKSSNKEATKMSNKHKHNKVNKHQGTQGE